MVSSMLAVGLSLTIGQIVAPLRNRKLVLLALLAMPARAEIRSIDITIFGMD